MFLSDYPRGVVICLDIWQFAAPDALPVAPALAITFLLARRRFPVSLLRFPLRPLPGFIPAMLAAIPLARLPRMKLLFTPFEQTKPRARLPDSALPPPSRLIFARMRRTLGRAHGR